MANLIGVPTRAVPDRSIPDRSLPLNQTEAPPEPSSGGSFGQRLTYMYYLKNIMHVVNKRAVS